MTERERDLRRVSRSRLQLLLPASLPADENKSRHAHARPSPRVGCERAAMMMLAWSMIHLTRARDFNLTLFLLCAGPDSRPRRDSQFQSVSIPWSPRCSQIIVHFTIPISLTKNRSVSGMPQLLIGASLIDLTTVAGNTEACLKRGCYRSGIYVPCARIARNSRARYGKDAVITRHYAPSRYIESTRGNARLLVSRVRSSAGEAGGRGGRGGWGARTQSNWKIARNSAHVAIIPSKGDTFAPTALPRRNRLPRLSLSLFVCLFRLECFFFSLYDRVHACTELCKTRIVFSADGFR